MTTQRRKAFRADVNLKHGGPAATAIARLLVDQSLPSVCVRRSPERSHVQPVRGVGRQPSASGWLQGP